MLWNLSSQSLIEYLIQKCIQSNIRPSNLSHPQINYYCVHLLPATAMKFRSRPLPRITNDWATTLFLLVTVPLTYWFELWLILPETISTDSTFYRLNSILGTFIMFGIISNMFAVMLCNTSIVGRKIVRPSTASTALWKFCAACESLSPPRAWHCSTCRVCILKRDHHCMFTGEWDAGLC